MWLSVNLCEAVTAAGGCSEGLQLGWEGLVWGRDVSKKLGSCLNLCSQKQYPPICPRSELQMAFPSLGFQLQQETAESVETCVSTGLPIALFCLKEYAGGALRPGPLSRSPGKRKREKEANNHLAWHSRPSQPSPTTSCSFCKEPLPDSQFSTGPAEVLP